MIMHHSIFPRPLVCWLVIFLVSSARAAPEGADTEELDKALAQFAIKVAAQIKDAAKKKATVLDFVDLQGNGSELGRYIAEQLTIEMVMAKRDFSVLDRANLKKILAEHKLTATGLVDPENAKKLGQFAGVDVLVLGNIVPKSKSISLTAKLIATDTAEILGAAKIDFSTNDFAQQLLTQSAKVDDGAAPQNASSTVPTKPFGDLQTKIESLNVLPGDNGIYGSATLTLVISNTSSSKIYGAAVHPDFYNNFNISNSRGDEFRTYEVIGIGTAFEHVNGGFNGAVTDISPKTAIMVVAKASVRWNGKPGDYRPYRLQTILVFGEEHNGRHPNLRKDNLIIDVK